MQQLQQDTQGLSLLRMTDAPPIELPDAVLALLWDEIEQSISNRRRLINSVSNKAVVTQKSATVRYAYD